MNLLESLRLAWHSLRANVLRASLTLLGISIGIAAVIVLAAVGAGARSQILAEFAEATGNHIMIMPRFEQSGKPPVYPDAGDAAAIRRALPGAIVVPQTFLRLPLAVAGKTYYPSVTATTDGLRSLQRLRLRSGRFLAAADEAGRARVCVLGGATADRLFGVKDPVGRRVRLGRETFRVIGVLAAANRDESLLGAMGGDRLEIYIPVATALAMTNSDDYLMLLVVPPDPRANAAAMAAIETALARRHGPKVRFEILATEMILRSLGVITSVLTALLVAVGGIALAVGGIGIMNIMLVSVTERTREIGIRKAVGAKRRDIMRQFLGEAVFLCLCGAAAGMGIGILGARVVAAATPLQPMLAWWIFALAVGFAAGVGLLFGTYPAWRAAKLNPIEALRHE